MSAGKEAASDLEVVLHPLVVISVSDQYTRTRLSVPPKGGHTRIIGVLLGTPTNGKVEITNSFDILGEYDADTGKLVYVDESLLRQRQQSYAEVFPTSRIVGWYEAGNTVDPDNAAIIARSLFKYTESMIVMMLDSEAAFKEDTSDVPITFYETEIKGEDVPNEMSLSFKRTPYRLVTIEAERIGIDHIAKTSQAEGKSQLSVHVLGMQGAMKMLNSRIQTICEYLKMVQEGTAPFDPSIMRKIGVLRDLLPVAKSGDFDMRFFTEYNDVLLLTYLSSLAEGLKDLNTMADSHFVSRPRDDPNFHHASADKGSRAKSFF